MCQVTSVVQGDWDGLGRRKPAGSGRSCFSPEKVFVIPWEGSGSRAHTAVFLNRQSLLNRFPFIASRCVSLSPALLCIHLGPAALPPTRGGHKQQCGVRGPMHLSFGEALACASMLGASLAAPHLEKVNDGLHHVFIQVRFACALP